VSGGGGVRPGMTLTVVWFDEDLVELRVRVANARFAATVDVYALLDCFAELAEAVRGFPRSSVDRREFELGNWQGTERSAFRATFGCLKTGPASVRVAVRSDVGESAAFGFFVEAAAIDTFVADCLAARVERNTELVLPAAVG
jgi:hypothetical protein